MSHFLRNIRFWPRRRRSDQPPHLSSVAPAPLQPPNIAPAFAPASRPDRVVLPMPLRLSKGPPVLPSRVKEGASDEGGEGKNPDCAEDHDLCAICLERLDEYAVCSLPCTHSFHAGCVNSLRSHCAAKLCPLCRTELPPSAFVLYDRAMNKYFEIERKQTFPWEQMLDEQMTSGLSHAVDILRGAAEQGHAEAQANYGFMCSMGRGVPQDSLKAAIWYNLAAEQGFAKAQLNLGVMFKLGKGVTQSDESAFAWFKRAAEQGYDNAQARLGYMYKVGCGVAPSDVRAVHWYNKAAQQGHSEAQCALGTMHRFGRGVPQNDAAATHWYLEAAKRGHAVAQRNLGFIYQLGQGIEQDDAQAMHWFKAAAKQGDSSAKSWLSSIEDKKKITGDIERDIIMITHEN